MCCFEERTNLCSVEVNGIYLTARIEIYSLLLAKKCTKIQNARPDPLFCSLNQCRSHCRRRIGLLKLLKGPVIRATFSFNLSRNIVALQDENCCTYYRVRDQLFSQQMKFCKFAGSWVYDWSVVCKQRWRLLNSFFVGRGHLPLFVWAFCSAKTRKDLKNKFEKFTCDNRFPGKRRGAFFPS